MATATKERKKVKSGTVLSTETLRRALAEVGAAVPSKHARTVLTNVLLFNGGLTGTDLELEVSAEIPWTGDRLLLPFARLQAIVRECRADEVSITVDGSAAIVSAGHGTWRLPVEDAEEFPTWNAEHPKPVCRLPADQFVRACKAVVYATDSQSSRYALGAVLLDVKGSTCTFVGTDGRRLSSVGVEHDLAVDDQLVLVPARAIHAMAAIAAGHGDTAVQLEATPREVIATIDGSLVTARQVEGRYPKWRDVFPEREATPHQIDVGQLLNATRAAAIVTTEASRGVTFTFSPDGILLQGRSSESGESSVTCEVVTAGTPCTVKIDPAFLVEFLRALPQDGEPHVFLEAVDAQSAVVLKCGDVRGVIMPLAD